MPAYCIIETESGWTIAECGDGTTAAEAAERAGGVVLDPGPYDTYDEAYDALISLQEDLLEDDASDAPGGQALEGRFESDD
jgi:hypothetical protein